ncbi:phage major capsid protein [Leuconostoc citreum]|uniref:phage major capsid protein n=1 Tax=Leuconostoc citreum TaxID=33964 RepID=UPI002094E042|nr:phage major capsid protein [Leuconostoc citreum]
MTNVSGLAVLNKVKDAMGNYLLQPDPTQSDVKQVDGKRIVVVADRGCQILQQGHTIVLR